MKNEVIGKTLFSKEDFENNRYFVYVHVSIKTDYVFYVSYNTLCKRIDSKHDYFLYEKQCNPKRSERWQNLAKEGFKTIIIGLYNNIKDVKLKINELSNIYKNTICSYKVYDNINVKLNKPKVDNSKPVIVSNSTGSLIKEFNSISQAAKSLKLNKGACSNALIHGWQVKGWYFKYKKT